MMKRLFFTFLWLLCLCSGGGLFTGCAGEDYTPVYFPGADGADGNVQPGSSKKPKLPAGSAQCTMNLEATLCVTIKNRDFEVGADPADPLCSETPPIPFELNGETIVLSGKEFPDINVHVNIKGVDTPMTINGRGDGDGLDNTAKGTWTPDGEIDLKGFAFYINVLGMSAKLPNFDLTTADTRETKFLEAVTGSPIDDAGNVRIVTATTLGHTFDAADKFLMGASMQAVFEGTFSPTLADCAGEEEGSAPDIVITKLHLTPSGELIEDNLPGENILEISNGTYIAESAADIGPSYEAAAYFKLTNNGSESIDILMPAQKGPFFFYVEGQTRRTVRAGGSIRFQAAFRPNKKNISGPGEILETLRFGRSLFRLKGVALLPGGNTDIDRVDNSGNVTASDIDQLTLSPLSVPASSVKRYFRCEKKTCAEHETLTRCRVCTLPDVQGCALYAINTEQNPLEEVGADCKLLHPEALPMISLNLSETDQLPLTPAGQAITVRNTGVADLIVEDIFIEDPEGSKSTGEFQVLKEAMQIGSAGKKEFVSGFPVTLPPYIRGENETALFLTVAYLPTDLIGFDGTQANGGRSVTDKALLKIVTNVGEKTTPLSATTKVQEVPELQAYFATATGLKGRAGNELFAFEEVTASTEDLAVPVFLKPADTAAQGLRISEIKLSGKDVAFFEWINTPEKLETRQPAAGKGKRCSVPIFDPASGRMIDEHFNLDFISFGSQGFDLKPGAFTLETMPLFGCINFHKGDAEIRQRLFHAVLEVKAFQLDPEGKLQHNPDGSAKESKLTVPIVAAIDPLRGKYVLRISQSLSAILNPTSPTIAAMPAKKEVDLMMAEGNGSEKELQVMMGALILDPFDEMEITDSLGRVVSIPGDGITAVFRKLEARPSTRSYDNPFLNDFVSLIHDSDLLEHPGVFYDYDFPESPLPENVQTSGWRIFTGSLSYPGPLHPRAPINRNECEVIDPCSTEGLSKFTDAGVGHDGIGACAFFYTSGGRYHSPAFEPLINGQKVDLCENSDEPQAILAMNTGHYSVDGSITVTDLGLRLWGPNYFLNPGGPLGHMPPMDELFHISFTTEVLKPPKNSNDLDVLPDEKIDFGKQEHKLNLTETELSSPPICPTNTRNRQLGGKNYSSWNYVAPLIFKDEDGEIPAGCPEPGINDFRGGTAFLKGRRVDPETGIFTLVTAAKFSNREELSLAFKNTMIMMALHGWLCNPQGSEENFEGPKCFDPAPNERDFEAQISYIRDAN